MNPKLISFSLCPYVQRCVIALIEKKVAYDIEYIDLEQKPDWFLKISPYGKVPVLLVGQDVLFESNVILEYLDEAYQPRLHPHDLVSKAKQRAWMDFSGTLLTHQYRLTTAQDQESLDQAIPALERDLAILSQHVKTPYFEGADYRLVDTAFAPFWLRMYMLNLDKIVSIPGNLKNWAEHLIARPSTSASVPKDLKELYKDYMVKRNSIIMKLDLGI